MRSYLLIILLGYLLGSSSMSYYISKIKKTELRDKGSKNLGASNTMMVLGWKYGLLVGIHDIGKSVLAVVLARVLFPELEIAPILAGIASVLGHIFPFYLKFKGGKGFASYIGMTLGLNWKLFIVIGLLVIIITLITDYIVLGTTLTITAVPIYFAFTTAGWIAPLVLLIGTVVIAYKHRMNYVRIYNGTEIGLRSANRGDHRG